jgi:SAM-dependent methyltransferase
MAGLMTDVQRTYVPAAGHHWSLPLYDPLVKLLGGDSARRLLVEQADLQPGHRVLEVGCGTGTLLVLLTRAVPALEVTGLDPDVRAPARAKRKADAASVSIQLDRGFSDSLPYADASFDRVFSCSCSTISTEPMRRCAHCAKYGECSSLVAGFTYSISRNPRRTRPV